MAFQFVVLAPTSTAIIGELFTGRNGKIWGVAWASSAAPENSIKSTSTSTTEEFSQVATRRGFALAKSPALGYDEYWIRASLPGVADKAKADA